MRLLIDTHALIWHSDASSQMSAVATASLNDPGNDRFLSIASVWEIAIKAGTKKLALRVPFLPFMQSATVLNGVALIPITVDDCAALEQLPFPNPKHRDPFDRMLVVQAARHGLMLVSADTAFDAYGITRVW